MNLAKPLTSTLLLLPALTHAHPGHPALPTHTHANDFLQSPALGLVAGIAAAVLLVAVRWLQRRARTTATRRR